MRKELLPFLWAVERGELADVKRMVAADPGILGRQLDESTSWVATAAAAGQEEMVRFLLDMGCDVNSSAWLGTAQSSALERAVDNDHVDVVELLLERGADPNLPFDRPMISAVSFRKSPERRLKFVRLLVEHGADVNRLYDLFGSMERAFSVLDWTDDPAVIAYLKSHGAKPGAELKAERGLTPALAKEPPTRSWKDEVIRYFEGAFGPVDRRALREIAASPTPISIHAVRPEGERRHLTLFTTGLSRIPMKTPAESADYALAELFIQLPGDWPFGPDCPRDKAWVIQWMRRIANHPREHDTWLGGPITVLDNDDPPRPLAPGLPFTSWLLFAERSFERDDGSAVRLYRLSPLHRDERDLERREGAPALFRAFDRESVPFIVDLKRKSVADKPKRTR